MTTNRGRCVFDVGEVAFARADRKRWVGDFFSSGPLSARFDFVHVGPQTANVGNNASNHLATSFIA